MASCKDCLSVDVCKNRDVFGDMPICEHFKDHNNFLKLPCKIKDLIDKVIGHNEIVAIWERRKGEEGRYSVLLWRGMAWDIPEEYLDRTFLKFLAQFPIV